MSRMRDLDRYFDYTVRDANDRYLGYLAGLWLDERARRPRFGAVRAGTFGRPRAFPLADAEVDDARGVIRLRHDAATVRDAPALDLDARLDPEEERRVLAHYGRAPEEPARGEPARRGARVEARDDVTIPLHRESLKVGKRTVETGGVRIRKTVRREVVHEPVEVLREEIHVERVPPEELRGMPGGARGLADAPFEEQEFVLRERREEPVVGKTPEVMGAVHAYKTRDVERRDVEAEVREEDVRVDRAPGDEPFRPGRR